MPTTQRSCDIADIDGADAELTTLLSPEYAFVVFVVVVLDDGPSLLDKLELIRRSNFYIGTACSWSQWARNVDTKVYIIYNRRPRDHNHDMRDLDTKDKYLILGELMTTS